MCTMKYRLVMWDFDGTLADTAPDVWESIDFAAREMGGVLPQAFKRNSNLALPLWKIYEKTRPYPGDENFRQFEKRVQIHYRTQNRFEKTILYPGAEELLCILKENGAKNHVITMKPHEALCSILANKNWNRYFESTISPDSFFDEMKKEQTKSEMINWVMRQTDGKEGDFVYIGDTWTDVQAAHDNLIDCIAVTYGDGEEEKLFLKRPKYYARNVYEIRNILLRDD